MPKILEFVRFNFPQQEEMIYPLFRTFAYSFVLAAGQKVAMKYIMSIRLQYWIRFSVASSLIINLFYYLAIRTAVIFSPDGVLLSTFEFLVFLFTAINLFVVGTMQWSILRRNLRQVWPWFLLIFPNLAIIYRLEDLYPLFFQAVLAVCVFLWIGREINPQEKVKNLEEIEANLSDNLPDGKEIHGIMTTTDYQISDT
jgi:hypothetical protein